MRRGLKFLCVLTILVILIGCDNKEKEEVVIWAWNKNVDILNEAIIEYKKINPDFKARVENFSKKDINTKITTAASLNDTSQIGDVLLGDWVYMRSNYELFPSLFEDLSDDITIDEISKFPKFSTDVIKNKNGDLYALPFGIGPTVTFAYSPIWDSITDDELKTIEEIQSNGWTWDDYKAIGEHLNKKNANIYMSAYNMSSDDRLFRTMNSQKGYWFMDSYGSVTIDNQSSNAAMLMVKELYDFNIVKHVDDGNYKSLMVNGNLAAQIQGFWLSGQLKDIASAQNGDWRILPCPSWNKNTSGASVTGGSYLYINKDAKNKNGAIDFIKWMTLEKESTLRTLNTGGIFPVLTETYEDERFAAKDNFFGSHNYLLDVSKNLEKAKPIYPSKHNGYNFDAFRNAQYDILINSKQVSIKKALDTAADKMRSNKAENE